MRTEQTIIRTFSELTEEEQHTAHEQYLESHGGMPLAWQDEAEDSLKAFCEVFPVKVREWSLFDGRGMDWRMTEVDNEQEVLQFSGQRLRTWLLNHYSHILYKGKYYSKTLGQSPYTYIKRYGKAMVEESCCPFTGYCMDDDLLSPIRAFIRKPNSDTLEGIMRDCMGAFITSLEDEAEAQQSFEYFADMATANKWEFDPSGKMV